MTSPPLAGHAIHVSDGLIADIVPESEIPADSEILRFPDGIAFPAFINMHTHLMWSGFRGLGDNLRLTEWIYDSLMPTFMGLSSAQIIESIRLGIKHSYRAGITTVLDCHFDPLVFDTARKEGLRGIYFLEAFGIYDTPKNEIKRVRKGLAGMLKKATTDARVGFSPHAPYTVTPPVLEDLLPFARENDLKLMTHLAETTGEREYFQNGKGLLARKLAIFPGKPDLNADSPLEYFEKYGLTGNDVFYVHCVDLNPAEISRIDENGGSVVTCPTSNAKLGCGVAPITDFLNSGIDVYLGTDSEASCDEFDMFEEMRRLILMQRGSTGDITDLNAEKVLGMCTVKAAAKAGFTDIGTLEKGMTADIVVATPDEEGVSSRRNPFEKLVWGTHNSDIDLVLTRGEAVFRKGE